MRARAFYSVPDRLLGENVRVYWDDRLVRIYHHGQCVGVYTKAPAGTNRVAPLSMGWRPIVSFAVMIQRPADQARHTFNRGVLAKEAEEP